MRLHLFNHAVESTGGTRWEWSCRQGRALAWFRRAMLGPGGVPPSYDELIAEAAHIPPGADGLTFLPYLTGERTPHADSNARGVFAGMHAGHESEGISCAPCWRGVAFALRDSLELIRRLNVDADEVARRWREAHAAPCGARCWRTCSVCQWLRWLRQGARRMGQRCLRLSVPASSRRSKRHVGRGSGRLTGWSPARSP